MTLFLYSKNDLELLLLIVILLHSPATVLHIPLQCQLTSFEIMATVREVLNME